MKFIGSAIIILAAAVMLTGCSDEDDSSEKSRSSKVSRTTTTTEPAESVTASEFDADKYFKDNSEKVIAVESADSYSNVITGAEAADMVKKRGFTQNPLTYDFDIKGNYLGRKEADSSTDTKAPVYQTSYRNEDGETWLIYISGSSIAAFPVSYNAGSDGAELILSETEELVSYYDNGNKYYVTIPKKSAVKVAVVDKIDAEALEAYTGKELEKL